MTGALRYCLRHRAVRSGAWACALSLCAAAAGIAFWWPVHQRVQQLERQLLVLRQEMSDRQQMAEALAAFERARQDVARLQAKLDYGGTQAQLVDDFTRLAKSNDVRILNEAYDEGRRTGAHGVLNADLAVRGSYRSLREFLDGLATLPSWSEIDAVELERAKEAGLVAGKVRIVTYRSQEQGK